MLISREMEIKTAEMPPPTSKNGHHLKVYKQQMLPMLRRKGSPPALLVGMQTGAAAMENSVAVP